MVKDLLDKLSKEYKENPEETLIEVRDWVYLDVLASKVKLMELIESKKKEYPVLIAGTNGVIEKLDKECVELEELLNRCEDDFAKQIWFGIWAYMSFGISQVITNKYIKMAVTNFCNALDDTRLWIKIIDKMNKKN